MKKLVMFDHLGNQVYQDSVYVEGKDYEYKFPNPTCIWLGTILIADEETIKELAPKTEFIPQPEPEPEPETPICPPHNYNEERQCKICGHQEEVTSNEPEAAINQSAGDKGSGEAEQPPSPEAAPKKPAKRKATKRGK